MSVDESGCFGHDTRRTGRSRGLGVGNGAGLSEASDTVIMYTNL